METWVDFLNGWGVMIFGDRTPGKLSTLTREGRKTVQMAKKTIWLLNNSYERL